MVADGKPYEITFSPSVTTADVAAREFCIRNAAAFEITTEEQLPACVGPVTAHIRRELAFRAPVTVSLVTL